MFPGEMKGLETETNCEKGTNATKPDDNPDGTESGRLLDFRFRVGRVRLPPIFDHETPKSRWIS